MLFLFNSPVNLECSVLNGSIMLMFVFRSIDVLEKKKCIKSKAHSQQLDFTFSKLKFIVMFEGPSRKMGITVLILQ